VTGTVRRGFLEVDPSWVEWLLAASTCLPSFQMSAEGSAWQWRGPWRWPRKVGLGVPFVRAAIELTGDEEPHHVNWWANVLRVGGSYRSHSHDGRWVFVYHLTAGTALHFETESFPATPGQMLVFGAGLRHWTDRAERDALPRVSIVGNLYYRRGHRVGA
jgi:hypothetical protein